MYLMSLNFIVLLMHLHRTLLAVSKSTK